MEQPNQQLIDGYLSAFESADTDRCMEYFDPEASIDWMMGTYVGESNIRAWHQDRFEAGLKIVRVDAVDVQGDVVTLEVTVTSKRLSAWRLPPLAGRVIVQLQNGKIRHAKFAVGSANP
jgi:hypothetical protein